MGQEAITNTIYYDASDTVKVDRVKLSLTGATLTEAECFVSTDGGSTWEEITTLDAWQDVINGNDLRLKIDNDTLNFKWGDPWGTPWTQSSTFTLTEVQLEYELV